MKTKANENEVVNTCLDCEHPISNSVVRCQSCHDKTRRHIAGKIADMLRVKPVRLHWTRLLDDEYQDVD